MDIWSKEKRSKVMSLIHGRHTKPELAVRSLLHRAGFRFSLHRRDLPGKPAIVLPKYRTIIFVHGCFWHQHKRCTNSVIPKTHRERWEEKLLKNVERDRFNEKRLRKDGWGVITVWECEIEKNIDRVKQKLLHSLFLNEIKSGSL